MVEFDYDNNEAHYPSIKISGLPREIFNKIRYRLHDLQRSMPGVCITSDVDKDPLDVFVVKIGDLSHDDVATLNGMVNVVEQEVERLMETGSNDENEDTVDDESIGSNSFHHAETTGGRSRIPLLKIGFNYESRDPERTFIVELLGKFRAFCMNRSGNRIVPKLGKTGGTQIVPAVTLYVYLHNDGKTDSSKLLRDAHLLMTQFSSAYGRVDHNGYAFEFVAPENNRGAFEIRVGRFEE